MQTAGGVTHCCCVFRLVQSAGGVTHCCCVFLAVSEPCTLVFDTAWLQPNSSSSFLSPNFPFPLPDNVSFNYTLRAPIGYYIHVTFSHFRLRDPEACSDVMEIDDVSLAGRDLGPRRLARLCGREDFVNDTVSELNSIRIVYVGGEAAVGDRGKRSVAEDEGPIGFNISFRVYPGNESTTAVTTTTAPATTAATTTTTTTTTLRLRLLLLLLLRQGHKKFHNMCHNFIQLDYLTCLAWVVIKLIQ